MYQSFFSYNLAKPYPYRWFTWVAVLGGMIATALFTVVNIAANGYELTSGYSNSPNQTFNISSTAWYNQNPWSFASKVSTKCQPATFEIGSRNSISHESTKVNRRTDRVTEFYTNSTCFRYEVLGITSTSRSQTIGIYSFTYHSNYLQNCVLRRLEFDRFNPPPDEVVDLTYKLVAWVNCTINTPEVVTSLTLGVRVDSENTFYDLFTLTAQTRHLGPAFWWPALILHDPVWQGSLVNSAGFREVTPEVVYSHSKRIYAFDEIGSNMAIAIYLNGSPIETSGYLNNQGMFSRWSTSFGNDTFNYHNTSLSTAQLQHILWMDTTGKLCYSYILTDLGQTFDKNVFAHEAGVVEYFNGTRHTQWGWTNGEPQTLSSLLATNKFYPFDDPAYEDPTRFYKWYNTGVPQIYPSYIETSYFCSASRKKPIGSIIVTVIVGDVVFLQALWFVLNTIVKFFLERKDRGANNCPRCENITMPMATRAEFVENGSPAEHTHNNQIKQMAMPAPLVIRRRPVPLRTEPDSKDTCELSVSLLSKRSQDEQHHQKT